MSENMYNFPIFQADSSQVFPSANSKSGGQLMTEFNLRSLESVDTDANVQYFIGKSFVHSMNDFRLLQDVDGVGNVLNTALLVISSGRALVNGHYFQTTIPTNIDLSLVNSERQEQALSPLKGRLGVGLVAMYSTDATMMGSIETVDDDRVIGIQLVVCPIDELKDASDSPDDITNKNVDIKLGEFTYINGIITDIQNYESKTASIDSSRLKNLDDLISSLYVTRRGLNPKQLYVFSGKEPNPESGNDTWCYATDSLIIWDAKPEYTYSEPSVKQATFVQIPYSKIVWKDDAQEIWYGRKISLMLPHKQVDGMTDSEGYNQYYETRELSIPVADYELGTAGTVDSLYTENIKNIDRNVKRLFHLDGEHLKYVMFGLKDRKDLPEIQSDWYWYDYVLVNNDQTVTSINELQAETGVYAYPTTMYMVIGGYVTGLRTADPSTHPGDTEILEHGVCVKTVRKTVPPEPEYIDGNPNPQFPVWVNETFGLIDGGYIGVPEVDFFAYIYYNGSEYEYYYYIIKNVSGKVYADEPILLTLPYQIATEQYVGGYLNIDNNSQQYQNKGYVYCDETGHLRVLDYDLLMQGMLAYQLGQNVDISGTASEIQTQLDTYVNNRIAFPNEYHLENEQNTLDYENLIDVTIHLSGFDEATEENPVTIDIHNIDVRFNTCVRITLVGMKNQYTHILVRDCEKIWINNNLTEYSNINIENVNLYYDSNTLDNLETISGLKLWWEKIDPQSDYEFIIQDNEVLLLGTPIVSEDFDYWSTHAVNDNHFLYALRSLKFDTYGNIIGGSIFICNHSTNNLVVGKYMYASQFDLKSTSAFPFPINRLTKPIKFTGSFVMAYPTTPTGYMTATTNFTLQTNYTQTIIDGNTTTTKNHRGVASFLVDIYLFENNYIVELYDEEGHLRVHPPIDSWDANSYHIFEGGVQ